MYLYALAVITEYETPTIIHISSSAESLLQVVLNADASGERLDADSILDVETIVLLRLANSDSPQGAISIAKDAHVVIRYIRKYCNSVGGFATITTTTYP